MHVEDVDVHHGYLVQENVIRAYRAVDLFDGRHPRAWLLTILRNTWRNMTRKARPHLLDTADEMFSVPAAGRDGRWGAGRRGACGRPHDRRRALRGNCVACQPTTARS